MFSRLSLRPTYANVLPERATADSPLRLRPRPRATPEGVSEKVRDANRRRRAPAAADAGARLAHIFRLRRGTRDAARAHREIRTANLPFVAAPLLGKMTEGSM